LTRNDIDGFITSPRIEREASAPRQLLGNIGCGPPCRYANKVVPVVLPDTIDTCVWDADDRRVHCF